MSVRKKWKELIVYGVCLIGIIFMLPNFLSENALETLGANTPEYRIYKAMERVFNFCYEHGDKGLDYLGAHAPLYNKLYDKYMDDYEEYFEDVHEAICYWEELPVLFRVLKQMEKAAKGIAAGYVNNGNVMAIGHDNNHDDADDQEPAGPARQPTDDATGKKIAKFMYAFAKKMRKHPKEASEVSQVADEIGRAHV